MNVLCLFCVVDSLQVITSCRTIWAFKLGTTRSGVTDACFELRHNQSTADCCV